MVTYRSFKNTDPPGLVEVWNEAFTGRGAVVLRNATPLERCVFSKPYFDPGGLIVAEENGVCQGFAHAALAGNAEQTGLSATQGVICLVGVRPRSRRRGIGTELLRHAETFLRERGMQQIQAGCYRPLNPFYLGLYGGSDSPGILASDAEAAPFLTSRGYRPQQAVLVLQRSLRTPVKWLDPRLAALSRRVDLRLASPKVLGCWFEECVYSPVEPLEFFLEERGSGQRLARTLVWEMEGFSQKWGKPAVGIVDFMTCQGEHRKGLGRYLLAQLLRHLQKEEYFELAEAQVPDNDPAAGPFFRGLGFDPVDRGQVFVRVD